MIIILKKKGLVMYVCICTGVTETDIARCVSSGACSLADLQRELGVATGCGCCREHVQQALEANAARSARHAAPALAGQ